MAKTKQQILEERAARQQTNLDAIISMVKNSQESSDGTYTAKQTQIAYLAACIAKVESNLGLNLQGTGTIYGLYQYSKDTWLDRERLYRNDPAFAGFDWEANRRTNEGQTKVFLADIAGYQEEFDNGLGVKRNWRGDGASSPVYAMEALEKFGLSWTLENYEDIAARQDL